MSITTTRRLATAFIAAAAAGSLALGAAGTAAADPGQVKTARFYVANKTNGPVQFMSIVPGSDLPVKGPQAPFVIEQGKSAWFDIQVWSKGGHVTSAYFETMHGGHSWGVDMKASDAASQAQCHVTSSSCSPKEWAQTTTVTLY
jgi:hypothetical protein